MAESGSKTIAAIIGTLVVVVSVGWILCKVFGICPFCPPVPDDVGGGEIVEVEGSAALIFLEDMHAAAWMPNDNGTFHFGKARGAGAESEEVESEEGGDHDHVMPKVAKKAECEAPEEYWGSCGAPLPDLPNYDTGFRHGILFQMGYDIVTFPRPDMMALPGNTDFLGVYIEYDGGKVKWLKGPELESGEEFDWLDVRVEADDAVANCVVDPHNAYKMFVNDIEPRVCPDEDNNPALYHCLRNRSIHAAVEAHWMITFWSDPDFYNVTPGPTDEMTVPAMNGNQQVDPNHGTSHVSYKFEVAKKVLVDHWHEGCRKATYRNVEMIRILYEDGSQTHGGFKHRPMNG